LRRTIVRPGTHVDVSATVQASAVAEAAAVPELAAPAGEANAAVAVRMATRTRNDLRRIDIERLLREGGWSGARLAADDDVFGLSPGGL
jgi:hypothetical protein